MTLLFGKPFGGRVALAATAAILTLVSGGPASGQTQPFTPVSVQPEWTVNIGGGQPVGLMTFIETIEKALGRPATRNYLPMQPGDVPRTFASTDLLAHLTGFAPSVPLEEGIAAFVAWYLEWRGC